MAATYFFRYEIKRKTGHSEEDEAHAVVIVDLDERLARQRLEHMHPWACVISVQKTPFESLPSRALRRDGARPTLNR